MHAHGTPHFPPPRVLVYLQHCAFPVSQQPHVDAFVSQFMLGVDADTNVTETDGNYTYVPSQWVDWTTPVLV